MACAVQVEANLQEQFYRIKYKLCLLMHVAVNNMSPAYITDILILTLSLLHHGRLHSHESGGFEVPVCGQILEEELFAAPALWSGTNFQTIYKGLTMSQHLSKC